MPRPHQPVRAGTAAYTQAFVLHGGALVVTPIVIGLFCAVIAYARRDEVLALVRR